MSTLQSTKSGRFARGTLVALVLGVLLISLLEASAGVGRAAQSTPSDEEPTATDARPHRPMARARRLDRLQDRCVRRAAFAVAGARLDAALAELVGEGTLTQDEADAVKAKLAEDRGGDTVDGGRDAAATPMAGASDTDSDARRVGPCARLARTAGLAGLVKSVADIVGLPVEDVASRLAAGETLAEIAAGEDVSRNDLIAALEAQLGERLDAAVAAGRLTESERAERADALRVRLEALVDHRRGDRAS